MKLQKPDTFHSMLIPLKYIQQINFELVLAHGFTAYLFKLQTLLKSQMMQANKTSLQLYCTTLACRIKIKILSPTKSCRFLVAQLTMRLLLLGQDKKGKKGQIDY